ncbi:MAG TPA: hypothetical protein VKV40_10535 [Ktedonobacteraceae bacterium]|nr:hypothetical protein [Ktedonobacteraceae bacterium]
MAKRSTPRAHARPHRRPPMQASRARRRPPARGHPPGAGHPVAQVTRPGHRPPGCTGHPGRPQATRADPRPPARGGPTIHDMGPAGRI